MSSRGTVRQRPWTTAKGEVKSSWQAQWTDAKKKRREKSGFRTKKEAEAWLLEATGEDKQRRYIHRPDSLTITEAVEEYLKHLQKRVETGDMERRSRLDAKSKLKHATEGEDGIGHLIVPDLTLAVAEGLFLDLRKDDAMTAGNARKVIAALRTFLSWCVRNKMVSTNELVGTRMQRSKREKKQANIPAETEIKSLLVKAEELPAPYGLYIRMAVLTGCRAGELRGLEWRHVLFDAGKIVIDQRAEQNGEIGKPKSEDGNREIPIPPALLKRLKENWMAAGRPNDGFIFKLLDGKLLDHDNFSARHWRPMLKKLGISLRFHDLRHYHASWLIKAGVPITEVSRRLGHSDPGVTLRIYSHALPEDRGGEELVAMEGMLD